MDAKERLPLEFLTLGVRPVSAEDNKNDKPVFGIVGLAEKVALPANAASVVSEECLTNLRSLHRAMSSGIKSKTWTYQKEEEFIREMPLGYLQKRLTKEELIAIHKSSFISNEKLDDFIKNDPDAFFFNKCWLSYHHSHGRANWNAAVKAYNAMKELSFDELGPDFTIKYDTSGDYNKKGYSRALRVYLDGEIGVLLYHKGKHVLTIALDFCQDVENIDKQTVRIQQIQCATPKGNRWLYKLPCNFVSYFTKALWVHFSSRDFTVELIKSTKVVEEIRSMYASNYSYAQAKWSDVKNMDEHSLKRTYGEGYMRHKLYCYDGFRQTESKIAEFDNDVWRIFKMYSVRIPGVRRMPAKKKGYNTLCPSYSISKNVLSGTTADIEPLSSPSLV